MSNLRAPFKAHALLAVLAVAAFVGACSERLNPTSAPAMRGAPLSASEMAMTEDVRLDSVKAIQRRAEHYIRTRGKVPGWLQAYRYWYEQRAYPNDSIDWSTYRAAVAQRDKMPAAKALGRRTLSGVQAYPTQNWEFMGPRKLDVPYQIYYGQGDLSGRINSLSFAPTAGTYFVGSAGGGVWKTTNSGTTWTPQGDAWSQIRTSAVAVHPTNSNIVYVGTGDYDGGASPYGIGIMKSTNGGTSWTVVGAAEMAEYSVRAITIDPENPSILHATAGRNPTTFGRVFRSTDGGTTWAWAFNDDAWWSDVAYGAKNGTSRYLYAVGERPGGAFWRSADRGASWEPLAIPLSGNWQQTPDIATSPTQPNTVYLLSGTDKKIWKSTTAGNSWEDITPGFQNDLDPGDNYNWSQIGYDQHISCSTRTDTNQDVVYVGLIDIVASPNGGQSWVSVGRTYRADARIHNDQHSFAVNPANPNECLVGCDGGIYKTVFNPGAETWTVTNLNSALGIAQFYRSAHHPTDPNRGLGGTQDNATPALLGDLTDWVNKGGGDGGFAAINPANPDIQYCTVQFLEINQTTNQWGNQFRLTPDYRPDRVPFIGAIAINPANPNYLYAGTNYLWRYDDAANSWTPRLGGTELATETNSTISYIAVAPTDANRLYVGSNAGELWTSGNGGGNWTKINTGSPALPDRSITSICVNPVNPLDIVVSLSGTGTGHVWRLTNVSAGTRVWVNKSGTGAGALPDLPANSVAIDPDDPANLIYVGLDIGCFATSNGGTAWQNATAPLGLPNVQVNDLHVTPGTGYLTAATYGRGLWRVSLEGGGNPTYSIAGTVTENGGALQGVTVAAKQGAATIQTATTGANGTYSIQGLEAGTYTVVPTKANYTFNPVNRAVSITNSNVGGINFTGTAAVNTYNVAGTITENGGGLQGVTVAAKQGAATVQTATTGANGTYSIQGLVAGSYTVVPTKANYTFNPVNRAVTVTNANVGSINFAGTAAANTYDVSGTITLNAAGLQGVSVAARQSGNTIQTGTTGANGAYTIQGLDPGSYSIVPSKANTTFTPASRSVTLTNADIGSQNFTAAVAAAPKINGRVTRNGAGFSGVTVSAGGVNDTTDANGNYSLEGLDAGTYTVTPSKNGVLFDPASRNVNLGASDVNNVSFASSVPIAPENLTGTALSGTQVRLNWTNVSLDETGYKVDRSINGGGFTEITGLNLGATANTVTLSGLQAGTNYTFRVRSYNQVGDCVDPPTVDVSTPATVPAAPTNLVAKAKKKKKILITWVDNSNNETGFGVQVRLQGTKEFIDIGAVSAGSTGAVITRLKARKTYEFRVYAMGKSGNSPFSNIASARVKK